MKYFTIEELCASQTAQKHRILNIPTSRERENLVTLVKEVLDPAREYIGRPVIVTSGFRCHELNKAVGGASSSQHTRGEAADITCYDRELNMRMFEFIRDNLDYDQLINEYDYSWVHVSFRKVGNRKQTLKIG